LGGGPADSIAAPVKAAKMLAPRVVLWDRTIGWCTDPSAFESA